MNPHAIGKKQKAVLAILISYYVLLCLFSFVGHNHGPDLDFHDTCPACQWDILNQEDFSEVNNILDAFYDSLTLIQFQDIPYFIYIQKQDYTFSTFSRAPPQNV